MIPTRAAVRVAGSVNDTIHTHLYDDAVNGVGGTIRRRLAERRRDGIQNGGPNGILWIGRMLWISSSREVNAEPNEPGFVFLVLRGNPGTLNKGKRE